VNKEKKVVEVVGGEQSKAGRKTKMRKRKFEEAIPPKWKTNELRCS
jgi:hypothetical protein